MFSDLVGVEYTQMKVVGFSHVNRHQVLSGRAQNLQTLLGGANVNTRLQRLLKGSSAAYFAMVSCEQQIHLDQGLDFKTCPQLQHKRSARNFGCPGRQVLGSLWMISLS